MHSHLFLVNATLLFFFLLLGAIIGPVQDHLMFKRFFAFSGFGQIFQSFTAQHITHRVKMLKKKFCYKRERRKLNL